jgi:hypothetical protein
MKMRTILLAASALALAACSAEPGSERWCQAKKEQPKSGWSLDDARTYATHSQLEGSTVGSEAWCTNLEKKPKGEWSADDAASYARHCVI